ncbi:replication protein RepA [Azospirillum halopraeferens]|uniref:replication protein RepA n=1 Tax=Azospirillum halopraeferens TaxID=34010 RepID=UPI0004267E14|nr:replication protein RepA [Azospirillum halopraeferens]
MGAIHDLIRTHGYEAARSLVAEADRRYVDLAARALEFDPRAVAHLYSGFAMTALPHRQPASARDIWHRRNGPFTLTVEPGTLPAPVGRPPRFGTPYGSRARLILIYLQSEAMRTGSPVVRLGHTMRDWMERMGVASGGSSYAAVRDQAQRLSACSLTVGWTKGGPHDEVHQAGIVETAMLSPRHMQRGAWDESVRLSDAFFEALRLHPLPVSAAAIRAVQNSSTVMDTYVWLCHRLGTVSKPVHKPWAELRRQLGPEYKEVRQFRAKFVPVLKEALAVHPGANVEIGDDGILLLPSAPAVAVRRLVIIGRPVDPMRWTGI